MDRLVPDEVWELFARVVPASPTRPQGGGRRRADDRPVLAAIVFVVTTGCTRRQLPPVFGASWQTVHRRWSAKLHGDKGHDHPHLRTFLRGRGIVPRIACRGVESSQRLGRHRWVVERTVSWLAGCRRLRRCHEGRTDHFGSFVALAAALICYRRISK
ncbi:transposase [Streptosporangium sp. NPDC048865]|uniref:transposase n=1 Tax=Streptosporangium sp. NPDC048865 TaxID=3155766 RepID=UPI003421C545